MKNLKKHEKVKLIVGMIAKRENICIADKNLQEVFGNIDFESEILLFTHTDYYQKEFGENLCRRFVSFKKLISPDKLAKYKITTNSIEDVLSMDGKRRINLDPGYISLSKLVLASCKDYSHRIYIGKGIFAEVTLFYKDKTFQPNQWTYPDYRTQEYIGIFNKIREIYKKCLR